MAIKDKVVRWSQKEVERFWHGRKWCRSPL